MLIQLKDIHKSYGSRDNASFQPVLQGLDFTVEKNDTVAILGPSGSGKSTLLNIVGSLDHPDSGSYFFGERDITGYSERELDRFRNSEVGFIFQFHHLLPQCSLLENVLIPTLANNSGSKEVRAYAEELLQRIGLWEHRGKLPGQLSGGECQRAAVVRSMINRPSLILADEPTGALDGSNVEIIASLMQQLNKEDQVTVVMVTHSRELASTMDRIFELKEGKLHQQ